MKRWPAADAKGILKGSDDAATEYWTDPAANSCARKFHLIIKRAANEVGLVQ